jgi:hypothetical protein
MDKDFEKKVKIAEKFTRNILKLIRFAETKQKKNTGELDHIKNLITISKQTLSIFEVIDRCKLKFCKVSKYIQDRNEDYFVTADFSEFIKKDERQRFLETIVQKIRDARHIMTQKEKDDTWELLNEMLLQVTRYMLLNNEYA